MGEGRVSPWIVYPCLLLLLFAASWLFVWMNKRHDEYIRNKVRGDSARVAADMLAFVDTCDCGDAAQPNPNHTQRFKKGSQHAS